MTYYFRHGARYDVSPTAAIDMSERLPAGTYTIKIDPRTAAYYLEAIDDMTIAGKIYGDAEQTATRILSTFQDRAASTGVMLTGEKGSGKTLLAKLLSVGARMMDIPTIVISQALHGEEFNSFIQLIEQPMVIVFDEFEKVYDRDDQEKMLTLLDGTYSSKKLFVLTCNDKYRVNEHMKNRPGRIYYRLDYKGLEKSFITEYCDDNLKEKTHIDSIGRIASLFTEFNFDMLKALVEEMNRYGEAPQEALKMLNAKPEQGDRAKFTYVLEIAGKVIGSDKLEDGDDGEIPTWSGNPLEREVAVGYYTGKRGDPDDEYQYKIATFQTAELVNIDSDTGQFYFKNSRGDKIALTRVKTAEASWSMLV